MSLPTAPEEAVRLLNRGEIRSLIKGIDLIAVVENALRQHADEKTQVPAEAYMSWRNSVGSYCRTLAMPGALRTGQGEVLGLKLINAAVSNPSRGIARAGGFTSLFDAETARPTVIAEGALVSALRTAAYSVLSLKYLGPTTFDSVAIIGCGNLAAVHAELLSQHFPSVTCLRLFDSDRERAEALKRRWETDPTRSAIVFDALPPALDGANVVVTVTTSDSPYIESTWLADNAFIAHVSLDDIGAAVFESAEAIFVDDIDLVSANPRRILGSLISNGSIRVRRGGDDKGSVHGTLGDVITGRVPAVRAGRGRVVSNPFGMSILDLAIISHVAEEAERLDVGTRFRFDQDS